MKTFHFDSFKNVQCLVMTNVLKRTSRLMINISVCGQQCSSFGNCLLKLFSCNAINISFLPTELGIGFNLDKGSGEYELQYLFCHE